jgi:hypothetical protein
MIPVDGADRGRLVSWTTVEAQVPYVLGWAHLDNANLGVMGQFIGPEGVPVRSGLAVRVRQSTDQPWPRILFTPDEQR